MGANPVKNLCELIEVTIEDGSSLSAEINLVGRVLCGIYMPASWTAANLTFQAKGIASGTFVNMYSTAGSELTVTAAASLYLPVDPINFLGVNFLKVRSGTSGSAVNQSGADRVLYLAAGIPSIEQ